MARFKVRCRHGVEYFTKANGSYAAICRLIKTLENCCCYVCHNRKCKQGRIGKQECKNECELFTKNKYCEIKEE